MVTASEARFAATNCSSVWSSSWTGHLDMALAKKFALPVQCIILNFHKLICCLIRKRQVLGTWLSDFWPRREMRGLWSVATVRRSHP